MTKRKDIHDDVDLGRKHEDKKAGRDEKDASKHPEKVDNDADDQHLEPRSDPEMGAKPDPRRKEVNYNTPIDNGAGGITYK